MTDSPNTVARFELSKAFGVIVDHCPLRWRVGHHFEIVERNATDLVIVRRYGQVTRDVVEFPATMVDVVIAEARAMRTDPRRAARFADLSELSPPPPVEKTR